MRSTSIENNVRRLIIDESPINPKYYEKMSELLDALIEQRRQESIAYAEYLARIVELTRNAKRGPAAEAYPASLDTPAKRALYDNLENNEALALAVHDAVQSSRQDDWRGNRFKRKRVENAIREVLRTGGAPVSQTVAGGASVARDPSIDYMPEAEAEALDALVAAILKIVTSQNEY